MGSCEVNAFPVIWREAAGECLQPEPGPAALLFLLGKLLDRDWSGWGVRGRKARLPASGEVVPCCKDWLWMERLVLGR